MKRILIVSFCYTREDHQEKLIGLSNQGIKVGLMPPIKWNLGFPNKKNSNVLKEKYSEIDYSPLRVLLNGRQGGYLFNPLSISKTIKEFKPDLIHIEQEAFANVAAEVIFIAKKFDIPTTLHVWENLEDKPLGFIRRRVREYILNNTKGVLASTPGAKYAIKK